MLTMDQKGKSRQYASANGFLNGAWLTGWVRNITKTGFLLQQTNNLNLALPITFSESVRLPPRVRERAPLHVIARVEGFSVDKDGKVQRLVRMRPLAFEQPSILNMPADHAWNKVVPAGAPTDDFRPISGRTGTLTANANVVKVAGFIESFFLTQDKADPTLILFLLQHNDKDRGIPVRIYGSLARPLAKKLRRGMPVMIEGRYQVKVEQLPGDAVDGIVPVDKLPYIHASNIRAATPEDIYPLPVWGEEMMRGALGASAGQQPVDESTVAEIRSERVNVAPIEEANPLEVQSVDEL